MPAFTSNLVAKWAAPCLMLLVSAAHLIETPIRHAQPADRGGFAMFSTVDTKRSRSISCEIETLSGDVYRVLYYQSLTPRKRLKSAWRRGKPSLRWYLYRDSYHELARLPSNDELEILANLILSEAALEPITPSIRRRIESFAHFSDGKSPGVSGWNLTADNLRLIVPAKQKSSEIKRVSLRVWRLSLDNSTATKFWTPVTDEVTVVREESV